MKHDPGVASAPPRASTGIEGLDAIIGGGLPRYGLYLIQGNPGSGKTTAALQFLREGVARGEPCVYVTLSETADELAAVAASHGWSLAGIEIYELSMAVEASQGDYTLFHPAEVELSETMDGVIALVERVRPLRVVFDSLSEMRLMARDALRYRRQILSLKQFFQGRSCTILLIDDKTGEPGDMQLESLAHGVVDLDRLSPEYGGERRRLMVKKLRGVRFGSGYHDFNIVTGGLRVFPRLVAAHHHHDYTFEAASSGVVELDRLLGGGLDRGSSTLIVGPAGSGKTSIALRFALTAIGRGEAAALYSFDEGMTTMRARARSLGWDVEAPLAQKRLHLQQVDPAELSPGEFADLIRRSVEGGGTRLIVLDSLNGYLSSVPEERHLVHHLHELLVYLSQRGVITIVVMALRGLVGGEVEAPVDVSYFADTVLLLRYFESAGAIRTAASVMKKRSGAHERTLREFRLGGPSGLEVGPPLVDFQGVLTGVPVHLGTAAPLLDESGSSSRR